ncbi:hypothetical protein APUTEX25_003534 [Auxenochlorella protothecoides]|uniref:Peptidase A1 domain-containing protein n=1 Tax=Auxenochlorella protothecoides TaxID=3075 RepID=A0A3M7L044_AUXPR|nr:hypothetical protein APUTEX25_003534 [Auxenochlorella protothecoides]|eukprot:RMZ55410.1 hypothetical protein APUTEX25_003534 [Auxenochlorella protothecoides]
MTYIPCAECGSSCGPNHWGGSFDPRTSNTSERIGCNSPKCICGSPQCGCTANTCTYTRSYAEHSSSSGLLVQDVMHLHDGSPPVPITFGCETRETGEIYWQTADGLLGMGRSPASVLNQLVAADQVANTFSLCLGSVRGDGALILGDAGIPAGVDMQGVRLTLHPLNYLFVHTFGTGKYCVGIFDNGNSGTLLGGIVFRNVLVHYDVSSDRVGFGLTECAALGSDIRPPCSIFDPKVVGVSWGLRD